MPNYRNTVHYSAGGQGWSESWYTNSVDHTAAAGAMITLMTQRVKLMPRSVTVLDLRVSDVDISRDSRVYIPQPEWNDGTYDEAPAAAVPFVSPDDAVLMELIYNEGFKNRKFLRGIPRDVVVNNRIDPANLAFNTQFLALRDILINPVNGFTTRHLAAGAIVYHPVSDARLIRATTRQTGRPFGQRPGRRRTQPQE